MEPFARIPLTSDDYENAAQRAAIDAAASERRRATRCANLGTFTGYRIGLDIGNGNIGWCILFEDGKRLRFMRAEDIAAHNRALPSSARRTQLPGLDRFVPLGTHKFDARDPNDLKSYSKGRAEARAARGMLDARQRRRLNVRYALQDAGLLRKDGEAPGGRIERKSDRLRVDLLDTDPSNAAHPHDLGRALKNALNRRGYTNPVGRAGADEDSQFAKTTEARYREALEQFGCRTVGEFLEKCAQDARDDRVPFRKRHRTLAWQKQNRKKQPKSNDARSYEVFQFLTPTHRLIREECDLLRKKSGVAVNDDAWERIGESAEFRRPLRGREPGRCRHFPDKYRCVAALPSFQRFRILETIDNLRDGRKRRLTDAALSAVRKVLEGNDKVALADLSKAAGGNLKLDRGDGKGARTLAGAPTDLALGGAFGAAWTGLPIAERDDWTMRFLRRHWPGDGNPAPWTADDEKTLERDAESAFGPDALAKADERQSKFEDRFAALSVKAARLLADCYEMGLSWEERQAALRAAGAPEPEIALYERLPYYGEAMPDQTVPAAQFAPPERTAAEERQHGRAANPDVHVVMNRVRAVVNAIIDMMGGILPTACCIEMARSAFSEEQAGAQRRTAQAREKLRKGIVDEIAGIFDGLGKNVPRGPALDRLVDRWKAAVRQGWRDYDGSEIPKSKLVDGAEYQLDHVEPAAFGDFRENNMFVSRFNRQKGRRLPWEAFGDDPAFREPLIAFAKVGLEVRKETAEKRLNNSLNIPKKVQERVETARDRAIRGLEELEKCGAARPDVYAALKAPPAVPGAFRPGDRAALFCRCGPDWTPREGGPAARDLPNIGWSTKLARRYLTCLGAESEPIKAWAVHALRCMFDLNKVKADLRNHAVDAFLVAHFDKHILKPAFDSLRHEYSYEELYRTRALKDALGQIDGGAGLALFEDFETNLDRLKEILPHTHTAHRPDNQWNPGDTAGGSFGALGGQNIYAFRPDRKKREELTDFLKHHGFVPADEPVLSKQDILDLYDLLQDGDPKKEKLGKKIELRYLDPTKMRYKAVTLKRWTALPLTGQSGAFIDGAGKFAIVGAPEKKDRRVVSTAEFSRMTDAGRTAAFVAGHPVFRRGDTVMYDGKALVVTGLEADTRLTAYPVDTAERSKKSMKRPVADKNVTKLTCDVLGRRLYGRGTDSRNIEPAPYPLRG